MKLRFFLFFILFPIFICALEIEGYRTCRDQAKKELACCEDMIKRFDHKMSRESLDLLKEILKCCERGIARCEEVRNDIHNKKKKQKTEQHNKIKRECDRYLEEFNNIRQSLADPIKIMSLHFEQVDKIIEFHAESIKKINEAYSISENSRRSLNNVEETVDAFNKAAGLCKEALGCIEQALICWQKDSFLDIQDEIILTKLKKDYEELVKHYKENATQWPETIKTYIADIKCKADSFREKILTFEEKGCLRSVYDTRKRLISILEELPKTDDISEEIILLKNSQEEFELRSDLERLTEIAGETQEDFIKREEKRKKAFFAQTPSFPVSDVMVPDGAVAVNGNRFSLYQGRFYRFLLHRDEQPSCLFVTVFKDNVCVHTESIVLPLYGQDSWHQYLTEDGMLSIPDGRLKEFGIELRLKFFQDDAHFFNMVLAQKADNTDYTIAFSFGCGDPLYFCEFLLPPPWQLDIFCKPLQLDNYISSLPEVGHLFVSDNHKLPPNKLEFDSDDLLVDLVKELKNDPLLIAQYVYNEIELCDPCLNYIEGVFYGAGVSRSPLMTYLDKNGTAWEQCALLVHLLRMAGYTAGYGYESDCILPKDFAERLLFTKLPENQTEAVLRYPFVVFCDGKKNIILFPWLKDLEIKEGYNLYNCLPNEYADAGRWILRYLKKDPNITKWIGHDGDDTLGALFPRFVENELRRQGLSIEDVGVVVKQKKKQYFSWDDFSYPVIRGKFNYFPSLKEMFPNIFNFIEITVASLENPQKNLSFKFDTADIGYSSIPICFDKKYGRLSIKPIGDEEERFLNLSDSDKIITVKVSYYLNAQNLGTQVFTMFKDTSAALCFQVGGASNDKAEIIYNKFSEETDESTKLNLFLTFIGTSYFEKKDKEGRQLAALHKVNPLNLLDFGLVKIVHNTFKETEEEDEISAPQVDMFSFRLKPFCDGFISDADAAIFQYHSLDIVNGSANEHQILRNIFNDDKAISTVKLLQLAYEEKGFLTFTSYNFNDADRAPELAKSLYFSDIKDLNLREVKKEALGQWNILKNSLLPEMCWNLAYVTPGNISNEGGYYKESGAFIFSPYFVYALISYNNMVVNGGLGSPLSKDFFDSYCINDLRFAPLFGDNYLPQQQIPPYEDYSLPLPYTSQTADVRPEHKSWISNVADPVDVATGAFYIDETDMSLQGSFPLEIRRNYSSRNLVAGNIGNGWKLSLNPFLTEHEDKLFISESDGSVIVYSYNKETDRYEVFPEDNPSLYNFNVKGIGGISNPFRAYVKDNILYGADGSKRYFKDGVIQKWVNAKGEALFFSYKNGNLSRITNINGDFCGFHYNTGGLVSEIYSSDGRRVSYKYGSLGDLERVVLPSGAVICYDYDRFHRVIRETKPHGRVLENVYDDDGRVMQQHTPSGCAQSMISSAFFEYAEGMTKVKDACGGTTVYKIFQNQIYYVADPLGHTILTSWYIDENSFFDAETGSIVEVSQKGASRSLKKTVDKRGMSTSYSYDKNNNLYEITVEGADLSGNGLTSIVKNVDYNDLGLCIEERVANKKSVFLYDEKNPYLLKRHEIYCGNVLISYEERDYDDLGRVVKENKNGSIVLYDYDNRGLPLKKTEKTGNDDPSVVTCFFYNAQGLPVNIESSDSYRTNTYDIMGNMLSSLVFSSKDKEELLSADYIDYDMNNLPICKRSANDQNIIYFDYTFDGNLKAKRTHFGNDRLYTLYEYDARGYLIEETDPLGHTVYREYDALGNVLSETKENLVTCYTYEAGGLKDSITTPSGAVTHLAYTTNGLLKEERYPDGTSSFWEYDCFGRVVKETKKGIAYEIVYDDALSKKTVTNIASGFSEIEKFDANGNLIAYTDAGGNTVEKSYDALGRIKIETSPTGLETVWSYQKNKTICRQPSGETKVFLYAGKNLRESDVFDKDNNLIDHIVFRNNPYIDLEIVYHGEETTYTWKNGFGLPIEVEKDDIVSAYEYDKCGNCISITDGEGRTVSQEFDSLGRLIRKRVADDAVYTFGYDADSNLTEYILPDKTIWSASYDGSGHIQSECIHNGEESFGGRRYFYENGYLTEVIDASDNHFFYDYDSYGRVTEERVGDIRRVYSYDPSGLLISAEQIDERSGSWNSEIFPSLRKDGSKVEREYNADGKLILESVYLNSELIQQSRQTWSASTRTLIVGNHIREFEYFNDRTVRLSFGGNSLSYAYGQSGNLVRKRSSVFDSVTTYGSGGLPEQKLIAANSGEFKEMLSWDGAGKLINYSSSKEDRSFSYNRRGFLKTAGEENYEFNSLGVRIAAPNCTERESDIFDRTVLEYQNGESISTSYDMAGRVIALGNKTVEWDPWGRLIKVTDKDSTWEAFYDVFDRRIRVLDNGKNIDYYYDPEEEFQEIGLCDDNIMYWEFFGPDGCDAVGDDNGNVIFRVNDALNNFIAAVDEKGIRDFSEYVSPYGPQKSSSYSDLYSFAESILWNGKRTDATGLILLGKRYYDPKTGRFLSPDPIWYPLCDELYSYAGGDPVNYSDLDGRFCSPIYQKTKSFVVDTWNNPQFQGMMEVCGGVSEMMVSGVMANVPGINIVGFMLGIHGVDHFTTGLKTVYSGTEQKTFTVQTFEMMGMSPFMASNTDWILDMGVSKIQKLSNMGMQWAFAMNSTSSNFRKNFIKYTGVDFGKKHHVHHVLPQKHEEKFARFGVGNIHEPQYLV